MRQGVSDLVLVVMALPSVAFSQPPVEDEPQLEEILEDVVSETDAEFENDSYLDHLNSYREAPLNLNTATEQELLDMGLLSGEQVQSLMTYRERQGDLLTLYELQGVNFFDPPTITRILPYVTVAPSQRIKLQPRDFYDGRHDILLRYQQTLESAHGYVADSTGETTYPGSPMRLYLRYRFSAGRKVQYGFTAEKDPGEQLFAGTQKTVDYVSAHLFLRDLGIIQSLAVGDYEVSIGQGLIMWSGFGLSKGSEPLRQRRGGYTLKPYSSVNENRFLRGAATTLSAGKFSLTVFGSTKKEDANVIVLDTLNEEVREVSSLQESGLHRTSSELADKHSVRHSVSGAELQLNTRAADIGVYGVYHSLSAEFNRSHEPYNQFQFSGRRLMNFGTHYTFAYNNVMLFGETAVSLPTGQAGDPGGVATFNAVQAALDSRTALIIVHRYYQKEYQTLFANAFGEVSEPNNEHGLYTGVRTELSQKLTLEGYADFYRHPWLRFSVDAPSSGQEYLAKLTYRPSYYTEVYGRFKYETKWANEPGGESVIDDLLETQKLSLRLHLGQAMSKTLSLRSRVEWLFYDPGKEGADEDGFMIYQDVIWSVPKTHLKVYGRFAMFDTDSYDTRIYAYENDVLYAFSIPAYYDKGTRVYLMVKYDFGRWCDVWLRVAQTYFANAASISTGADEIAGQTKTELKAQVRLSF